MTAYRLDRSGVARLAWEAPEEETPEQRIARRYREGKCVGCTDDSAPMYHSTGLCTACHAGGQRFCRHCGRVVDASVWCASWSRCNDCNNARRRAQTAATTPLSDVPPRRRAQHVQRERARERAAEMGRLRDRGWTFAEIGRRYGISASAASSAYYTHRDLSVLKGQARADAMRAMLDRGMTLAQVGARFGITGPATWNFLRRWEGRETKDAPPTT